MQIVLSLVILQQFNLFFGKQAPQTLQIVKVRRQAVRFTKQQVFILNIFAIKLPPHMAY